MHQRRKPRILAAIGLTVGALTLPAVAGASYIPDILRLGPDTGYRFNGDELAELDDDDNFTQRLRDALDKVEQQQLDAILNGDDIVPGDLVERNIPPEGIDWEPAPHDPSCPGCAAGPPPPPLPMTLDEYFSLEWGW